MITSEIKKWAKQLDFLNTIKEHLSQTLTQEQIQEYKMNGFIPYIDTKNNQTVFNSVPEKNNGFVYLTKANGEHIILEYRNEKLNTSDFRRVNDVYDELTKYIKLNISQDSNYNPAEIPKYESASATIIMLSSFLEKDPVFVSKEKVRQEQKKVAQQLFGQWLEGASDIKFFELEHPIYSSEKTFIRLFEKDGYYKILQSTDSSYGQTNKELTLEDVNGLLKRNFKQESLDNLQTVHTLVNEKHLLEDKIKSFRKPNGDEVNTAKNKL